MSLQDLQKQLSEMGIDTDKLNMGAPTDGAVVDDDISGAGCGPNVQSEDASGGRKRRQRRRSGKKRRTIRRNRRRVTKRGKRSTKRRTIRRRR